MKDTNWTISVITGIALTTNAFATIVLDDIIEEELGGVVDTGLDHLILDEDTKVFRASILLENAGYADENRFGIFDKSTGNTLELFSGSDGVDDSVEVRFNFVTGMAWVKGKPSVKVVIGREFGFYLDSSSNSGGGFFYSDPALNAGTDPGQRHGLIFDTRDIDSETITDVIATVVAFEDLRTDSVNPSYDGDYNDMVVGLNNVMVSAVPEPATLVLLGLGGLSLFRVKRRAA